MERQMDSWNDGRLDELTSRVDKGFEKIDERFEKIESEMKAGFAKAASKEELKEVKDELKNLSGRIDRLLHAFVVAAITFGVGVFGTFGGVVLALLS